MYPFCFYIKDYSLFLSIHTNKFDFVRVHLGHDSSHQCSSRKLLLIAVGELDAGC